MLKECLTVFEKQLEEYGDKLILDSYTPTDGTYIIIKVEDDTFSMSPPISIKLDKKTGEINQKTNTAFEKIKYYDYYSQLITMNKPMDKDKIIHSNNCLSFFVKKENLTNGKLTNTVIDNYYEILSHPELKYMKSRNSKETYQSVEQELGPVNIQILEKIKEWIKSNIYGLDIDNTGKDYLKIFFEYPIEDYIRENKRYLIPNIYNSNDFNIKINSEIYGLPNDNMGLNSKKPYLENKTRKLIIPYILNKKNVILQKKFFDYLMNQAAVGKVNIYISQDEMTIGAYKNGDMPDYDFNGIFLRLKKGMEVEIHNFDVISGYRSKIKKEFHYKNILKLDVLKEYAPTQHYGVYQTRKEIQDLINDIFFSKYLINNYFTQAQDLKINEGYLKNNLLVARDILFNWFYKGTDYGVEAVLDKVSLQLIKGSIGNGYIKKAGTQFNLKWSLKKYFNTGGIDMAEVIGIIRESLRAKINAEDTLAIENDNEYFFAVGQLVSYFISLSKENKKTHSLANSFINGKNDNIIKEKLRNFYKKYNYAINVNSRRFKNLYALILGYQPESDVNQDMIIAGYLNNNLIYEKTKED